MPAASSLLLDSLSALADPTRCRMLIVLERQELTVTELCAVLQLPQSTVSRHLKTLADTGLVVSRRDGTSRYSRRRPMIAAPRRKSGN
jgi:ArsR family transcriptional regulator